MYKCMACKQISKPFILMSLCDPILKICIFSRVNRLRKSQTIERQNTTTTANAVLVVLVFWWHLSTIREESVQNCYNKKQFKYYNWLAAPYLHFLVVVLNSLLLPWPLWAAEMTTAKENPGQRDNVILVQITKICALITTSSHNLTIIIDYKLG